jgi:VWFA-related protein
MPPLILVYRKGMSRAVSFMVAAVCFLGFASAAQTPQAAQAPVGIAPGQTPAPTSTSGPTLRVTTREVLLDVLVMDKAGQPVTDLKAADFTVTEEGDQQVIRRVEEHHPMPAADVSRLSSVPVLPPNTFSNFTPVRNTNASIVLLLDAMDSPPAAQMEMRQQLIDYLKHMQPGPPVAIFQLDTEMRLIQGFTSDPKLLLAAAESKRDMPSIARPTAAPRSYSGDAVYRRTLMETLRNGMRMMGSYLAGFPGRKNLIWFTGQVPMTIMGMGFGNPFRDGLSVREAGSEVTELTDVLTVSRVAVYPVDTQGLAVAPDFVMRRNGFPSPASRVFDHTNMDLVAEQTGGKAYYNTNDFTRVIEDVVRTGSSYYSVAYATTNTKWNGELRHIKVIVDRPEAQVQHKEGYYAYNLDKREQSGIAAIEKRRAAPAAQTQSADAPSGSQAPSSPQGSDSGADVPALGATVHHSAAGGFAAAMGLGAVPPTEIVFAARIQVDTNTEKLSKDAAMPPDNFLKPEWRHKPFRNFTIFYDADVHRVRFTQTPDGMRHGSIEFVALVFTSDGEQVNSMDRTAQLDVTPNDYRELLVSGLQINEQIAVPVKGNFFFRLGVHDKTGDQVGALEIPVDQIRLDVPVPPPQTP